MILDSPTTIGMIGEVDYDLWVSDDFQIFHFKDSDDVSSHNQSFVLRLIIGAFKLKLESFCNDDVFRR